MSAGQPSEVDLDLLADYVGGALEGTGQETAVARLIAGDPAWAHAHAWLTRNSGDVRHVLAEWGAVPAPMPADVVGRLTAALAAASSGAAASPAAAAPADVPARSRRGDPPADGPRGRERPARGSRPLRRREGGTRRPGGWTAGPTGGRRIPRWATPVAVVAALLALAGLGVTYLAGDRAVVSGTALSDNSAEREGPASATMSPGSLAASAPVRLATGTDYSRTSLADQVNAARQAAAPAAPAGSGPQAPERASGGPVPGAKAAKDQDRISACITAITEVHGRGALRVEWVDAASFEGLPALVVVFVDRTGERWAWVASPDCGQPQVGAATRYSSRVG